jgi:hypothetical protein
LETVVGIVRAGCGAELGGPVLGVVEGVVAEPLRGSGVPPAALVAGVAVAEGEADVRGDQAAVEESDAVAGAEPGGEVPWCGGMVGEGAMRTQTTSRWCLSAYKRPRFSANALPRP